MYNVEVTHVVVDVAACVTVLPRDATPGAVADRGRARPNPLSPLPLRPGSHPVPVDPLPGSCSHQLRRQTGRSVGSGQSAVSQLQ